MRNHLEEEDFLANPNNRRVAEKTIELIHLMADKVTQIECAAFNVEDIELKRSLYKINCIHFTDRIEDLVNFTITFSKRTPHGK